MGSQYKFKVRVNCLTYNHSPYIEEAMNGFCMQKTIFPFVCTIVDDASTDGTPDIIRKYLDDYFEFPDLREGYLNETDDYTLVFARHKTNTNCFFNVIFLKYNHYQKKKIKQPYFDNSANAQYIAMCEGDDYWTSPDKLQIQVDYLEQHDECVLCYCDAQIVDKESKEIYFRKVNRRSGNCTKSLILEGNYIITAGVCYRHGYEKEWTEVLEKIPFPLFLGDKPHWIFLSTKGEFKCFPQKMIAYRKLEESASHTKNYDRAMAYSDNVRDINLYFNKLFNVGISESILIEEAQIHRIRCAAPIGWKVFFREIGINIVKKPLLIFNFNFWKAIAIKMVSTFK